MFFNSFIELMRLKPTKWYNFITKAKNFKLIYKALNDITNEIERGWRCTKIDTMLDFAQCVYAVDPIFNSYHIGISVKGLDTAENEAYNCSDSIISIGISSKRLDVACIDRLDITIYKDKHIMTVEYILDRSFSAEVHKFTLGDPNTLKLTNTDICILKELKEFMLYYFKEFTEYLVHLYT